MNTILITARVAPLTTKGQLVLRPLDGALTTPRAHTSSSSRGHRPGQGRQPNAARSSARCVWMTQAHDSWAERCLYLALAAAAFAGLVLGVLTVLEQAQNWPIFNAWVGRILGA